MLLFWRIRYLDTRDRQLKDRDLWLDTDTLDPVTKAAIEFVHDQKDFRSNWDILQFRHIFKEQNQTADEVNDLCRRCVSFDMFSLENYFEDENGNELTNKQRAIALTGDQNAVMFPRSAKQYDIDYALSDRRPIPLDQISITVDQHKILGKFIRDVKEMTISTFFKEGPGTISAHPDTGLNLKTSVTDEEIRSFVTIFRRLYMEKDPANFLKSSAIFCETVKNYSLANFITGIAGEYREELDAKPDFVPFVKKENLSFSQKRLIDVFLYTQYAHQPDDRRTRQFQKCLADVGNNQSLLTWLFLGTLFRCALHMINAGAIIADFYDKYCQCHKIDSGAIASIAQNNPGIGTLEKKQSHRDRIFREKTEELAKALWEKEGRPQGGPEAFISIARNQLASALKRGR